MPIETLSKFGSRLHNGFGEIPAVWIAASRHCDVVSNNHYDFLPSHDLPAGADGGPVHPVNDLRWR